MKKYYIFLALLFNMHLLSQEVDAFDLVRLGDLDKLSGLLMSDSALIDQPNKEGFTLLILAAYKGQDEIVDFLLNKGVNVNYSSEMGTALTAAVFRGDYNLSLKLLKNKANPNLTDLKGVTPLMYATQFKNKDIMKLLLQYNSDKKIVDRTGKTAFEFAINSKDEEVINILK